MLPVYKAISFSKIIKKGGRTKPWVVLVDTPTGVKTFVVKMFPFEMVEANNSVLKELVGNYLASEFNLNVPKAALIKMDSDFEITIHDQEALDLYQQLDERVKFGTELILGGTLYNPGLGLTKTQVSKFIEIDTLFAFDNLIRNRDRGEGKPNLLIKDKEAYLIDHELGFELEEDTLINYLNGYWDDRFVINHIFYKFLRSSRKKIKLNYFEEFRECAKSMNINEIANCFKQLSNEGYSISLQNVLTDYLLEIKRNSSNFVNTLRKFI